MPQTKSRHDGRGSPTIARLSTLTRIRQLGTAGTVRAIRARIVPWRFPHYERLIGRFAGNGLEIGGPSAAFGRRGLLPLYPLVDGLDNVNFSGVTIWEGS